MTRPAWPAHTTQGPPASAPPSPREGTARGLPPSPKDAQGLGQKRVGTASFSWAIAPSAGSKGQVQDTQTKGPGSLSQNPSFRRHLLAVPLALPVQQRMDSALGLRASEQNPPGERQLAPAMALPRPACPSAHAQDPLASSGPQQASHLPQDPVLSSPCLRSELCPEALSLPSDSGSEAAAGGFVSSARLQGRAL